MISLGIVFAIFFVISAITFMCLFAGYSSSADVFCNKYAGTTDPAVGPNGLVVMWMRAMGISIIAWVSLFSLLAFVAFVNFDADEYTTFEKERRKRVEEESGMKIDIPFFKRTPYEFQSSGNTLYDARLYYEMYQVHMVNITDVLLLLAFVHYVVWIITGLVISPPLAVHQSTPHQISFFFGLTYSRVHHLYKVGIGLGQFRGSYVIELDFQNQRKMKTRTNISEFVGSRYCHVSFAKEPFRNEDLLLDTMCVTHAYIHMYIHITIYICIYIHIYIYV